MRYLLGRSTLNPDGPFFWSEAQFLLKSPNFSKNSPSSSGDTPVRLCVVIYAYCLVAVRSKKLY